MISRRKLLVGSALGSSVMLAATSAMAFSTEEVPAQSGLGIALNQRCGGSSEHAQLIASLRARLAASGAPAGQTATATCPICGCPVYATAQ